MSEHGWQDEVIEEVDEKGVEEAVEEVAEATDELYGPPNVEPSLYFCNVCEQDYLADELRWSRDGEARCPVCGLALNLA